MKNIAHVGFNDKNLKNVRFIKVNSIPTLEEQLTTKIYVVQALSDGVDDSSLLRLDPNEKLKLGKRFYSSQFLFNITKDKNKIT